MAHTQRSLESMAGCKGTQKFSLMKILSPLMIPTTGCVSHHDQLKGAAVSNKHMPFPQPYTDILSAQETATSLYADIQHHFHQQLQEKSEGQTILFILFPTEWTGEKENLIILLWDIKEHHCIKHNRAVEQPQKLFTPFLACGWRLMHSKSPDFTSGWFNWIYWRKTISHPFKLSLW